PSDWDWVQARSNCSIQAVFKQLMADARANTKVRQDLVNPERDQLGFRCDGRGNELTVSRMMNKGSSDVVFSLKDNHIVVERDGHELCRAALTLTNTGECRLKVGDRELDRWQF